jgi:hypothetical protein
VLRKCIFTGNHAGWGGAVSNEGSTPKIISCTFSGNYGGGNAMCNWSDTCNPTVRNSILWDGGNEILNKLDATIDINYSDVEGGWLGLGNIDVDPCFLDPGYWDPNGTPDEPNDDLWVAGDYHLKSEGWRLDRNFDPPRWGYDYVTSRCIDTGNPGSPLGGELLTIPGDPGHIWGENLRINMGAYGGTRQASMPPYDWALLADITNDGIVNGRDFAHEAKDWLINAAEQPGDLNRDGVVDTNDVGLFVDDWLETTTWHE